MKMRFGLRRIFYYCHTERSEVSACQFCHAE